MIINEFPAVVPESILKSEHLIPQNCLFFDIETTGLSWRRSHLYLLGAVFFNGSQWIHRQWFCQKPGEEKEVLIEFSILLNNHSTLIHFNGSTFDIPYLMHKYTFYRLTQEWDHLDSLDLYKKMHPFKKLLGMEHMRQKDLEVLAGLHREDPYSGGELISYYGKYLQTNDQSLLHMLLLHNQEDIEGMLQLLPLLALPRILSGNIPESFATGFYDPNTLSMGFSFRETFPLSLSLSDPLYSIKINPEGCTIHIPISYDEKKYFYSDYKDYYYLPLEDEAIHKSVAVYVDKEHREKAKASNCYKKTTGRFLPQFDNLFTPQFLDEYKDSYSWFLLTDDFLDQPDQLRLYASHLLRNYHRLEIS